MFLFGVCRTAVNAQSGVQTPAAGIITGGLYIYACVHEVSDLLG